MMRCLTVSIVLEVAEVMVVKLVITNFRDNCLPIDCLLNDCLTGTGTITVGFLLDYKHASRSFFFSCLIIIMLL